MLEAIIVLVMGMLNLTALFFLFERQRRHEERMEQTFMEFSRNITDFVLVTPKHTFFVSPNQPSKHTENEA